MRALLCAMAVLAVVSAASGQNLVVNGTFDTDLTGWNKWAASWGGGTSDVLVDGGLAWHFNEDSQGSAGIYQFVPVPVGAELTLNAQWAGTANNGWAEVLAIPVPNTSVDVLDALDSGPNVGAAIRVKHEEVDWGQPYGEDFSTPRWLSEESPNSILNPLTFTATEPYVLLATKVGNNANFWIDNITLTPEPASLFLLALGLPLLRRRH
ncbi:MAG TPA: hypothetical protein PL151_07830 [Phycisphaerae bacterium]|nr:hypothetical protein [Phycisphaerae bacterium]HOQ85811.1 hypothetical protein [Phycisphaerae bacterium]HPU27062.1 hypothetical protein [Phycisphaerae bacterium]HPZ97224.1 hypothetical protein [Phycisphaerae bacterium]HQE27653.1 hypothetical protein [Phycisphaerae bacterium]